MAAEQVVLAGAIFLSLLIVVAVHRQRTPNRLQKGLLIVSILFLSASMITNLLLGMVLDPADIEEFVATAKRVQGALDIAFALGIGAFVLVTTTPSLDTGRKFLAYLRDRFPNSYAFYAAVLLTTLAAIVVVPTSQLRELGDGRYVIVLPLWFLALVLLAVLVTVLYPWYKVVHYLRRTGVRLTAARDAYLIVVGVTGYVLAEFSFELILPAFLPELRNVGFLIQMGFVGLLAMAVRRREFLQVLAGGDAEDRTPGAAPSLPRGTVFRVPPEDRGFPLFLDLLGAGLPGLCITRLPPERVAERYGLERTPVLWLSRVAPHPQALRPTPLEDLALALAHFLETHGSAVVLLDGLEYLMTHNGFPSVLKLVQDASEMVTLHDALLLLPLDPGTLSSREHALLARETAALAPPGRREEAPPEAPGAE